MFLIYGLFIEDFQKVFNFHVIEENENDSHDRIINYKEELSLKDKIKGSFQFIR